MATLIAFGQTEKRALEHDDFDTWKRITGQRISKSGQWKVWHEKPGKGDQTLHIADKSGTIIATFPRAVQSRFSWDERYVAFLLKPAHEEVIALRRKKVKKDKLPKDTLAVYDLKKRVVQKIPRVLRYKMPQKWSGWLTYTLAAPLPAPKDTTASDSTTTKEAKPKKKAKKVNKENGYPLVRLNLNNFAKDTIAYVLDYVLAEEGKAMLWKTTGVDSIYEQGVYYYNYDKKEQKALCKGKGKFFKLTLDKAGKQAAFVADFSPKKALIRDNQLRYWKQGMDSAEVKLQNEAAFLPKEWMVSANYKLSFSELGKRLFFGTAPYPLVQDTNLLPEEIIKVEIWNYKNGRLHTQQNVQLNSDKKKAYLAVFDIDAKKLMQLGTEMLPSVRTTNKGDAEWALGISYLPYEQYVSWEGFPRRQDIYRVNVKTGEQELIRKDLRGSVSISPQGKYIYWYNAEDSTWTSMNTSTKTTQVLNKAISTSLADEQNDVPNYPYQYGLAGWTKNDAAVLLYDRYDIWKVDMDKVDQPVNLTNGRADKWRYRYVDLDYEQLALDENMLLKAFNETTRGERFYRLKIGQQPKLLLDENFRLGRVMKAKYSEDILYTKESFERFPNLIQSTLKFTQKKTISDANPEQKNYRWGTVDLYQWTSLDGKQLDGLLYKPEGFDATKKYPMLVYFYERNSEGLHRHQGVVPHRSIINPAFYTSRGYLVFVPDIVYRDGYPGESCYNAVIPGVTSLIEKGFVDKDKIGVQGHSWGGYQIAYLVTRTNIFKAAEAGAPVSNMTSAYGGIRWGSGYSRMFQYEHTQSRMGGTLWEYPRRYVENSPIFYVDKIETPLLILHNDKDGAVPWYQGIELYVALRRLGKPSWMLNYNGEPHWPTSWQNIRDFNIRLQQYFDHYLLDKPIPEWMDRGIPAIEKGINKGYKLLPKDGE